MAKAERWKYAGHEGLKKGGNCNDHNNTTNPYLTHMQRNDTSIQESGQLDTNALAPGLTIWRMEGEQ